MLNIKDTKERNSIKSRSNLVFVSYFLTNFEQIFEEYKRAGTAIDLHLATRLSHWTFHTVLVTLYLVGF